MSNSTSLAAINHHKNQTFDFNNVAGLGAFWDGTKSLRGGASKPGGGSFNNYTSHPTLNVSSNIDNLYQSLVGRNADSGGRQYWGDRIKSGADTYETLVNSLKASKEYTGQQAGIAQGMTAEQLKMLPSAHVNPFHSYSGSAAAGWKPGDPITLEMARASATTESNPDGSQKLDDDGNYIKKSTDYGGHKNMQEVYNALDIDYDGNGSSTTTTTVNPTVNPTINTGMSQARWDELMNSFNSSLAGYDQRINDLQSAYADQTLNMQNMLDNYQRDWRGGQQNLAVKGVRTQNELPSWSLKTGGARGFFGRGGRGGGLTTSSLNI